MPATIDDTNAAIMPAAFVTPRRLARRGRRRPSIGLSAARIPRGDVTTLHGDGGAGKTDIALRLAANVARGAQDLVCA